MRYRLICVGRVREAYVAAAVDDFERRLRRIDPLEIVEVAASHGADPARAVREEAEAALKRVEPSDVVWLLERTGRAFSSVELSERLLADHDGLLGLDHLGADLVAAALHIALDLGAALFQPVKKLSMAAFPVSSAAFFAPSPAP